MLGLAKIIKPVKKESDFNVFTGSFGFVADS